jgi:predicted sulfurtransferase
MIDLTHTMYDEVMAIKGGIAESIKNSRWPGNEIFRGSKFSVELRIASPIEHDILDVLNAMVERDNLRLPRNLR